MILDEIVDHKRRRELPSLPAVDRAVLRDLPPCRGFRAALTRPAGAPIRVIAETKKGSPSAGVFREDYDPVANAFFYVAGGASCLSVLTDGRFFFGALEDLARVRAAVELPVLQKDVVVDERQLAAGRAAGADCALLIVACLEDGQLRDLAGFAREWGMDVLVEVHAAEEATRAGVLDCDLIGINNRDLSSFAVDLETTFALLPDLRAAGRVLVSESGIRERAQCARLEEEGVDAILVGEHLMRADDAAAALAALRGAP